MNSEALNNGDLMHIDKINAFIEIDKIGAEQLLSYIFGLTQTESRAYFLALGESAINVRELSHKLGKDRTTTQRILTSLIEKELMNRQKINLKLGGIKYKYAPTDFGLVKDKMRQKLQFWHEIANSRIEEL